MSSRRFIATLLVVVLTLLDTATSTSLPAGALASAACRRVATELPPTHYILFNSSGMYRAEVCLSILPTFTFRLAIMAAPATWDWLTLEIHVPEKEGPMTLLRSLQFTTLCKSTDVDPATSTILTTLKGMAIPGGNQTVRFTLTAANQSYSCKTRTPEKNTSPSAYVWKETSENITVEAPFHTALCTDVLSLELESDARMTPPEQCLETFPEASRLLFKSEMSSCNQEYTDCLRSTVNVSGPTRRTCQDMKCIRVYDQCKDKVELAHLRVPPCIDYLNAKFRETKNHDQIKCIREQCIEVPNCSDWSYADACLDRSDWSAAKQIIFTKLHVFLLLFLMAML